MSYSQSVIELSFTGKNYGAHVDLDSVHVRNLSRDCDTVLYWPDSVLVFGFVGITEFHNSKGFAVSPAYPNPTSYKADFNVSIPGEGEINIIAIDLQGRVLVSQTNYFSEGQHHFSFYPSGASMHTIMVSWKNVIKSIKVISNEGTRSLCSLEYIGGSNNLLSEKSTSKNDFLFIPGDDLLYIGYYYGLPSGLTDGPVSSEDYTFEFATNIPCPDAPYVIYEGHYYNTVQIAGQCWMKENLNVGMMIQGSQVMEDNGIIEKYCVKNTEDSCDQFGGLYLWEEVMAYENAPGVQGICPSGWHIPTDQDWKILEGVTDSQYPIGDPIWDQEGSRGHDAGSMMKSTTGWLGNGSGANKSGFTAVGAGMRNMFGSFTNNMRQGYHWSSSEQSGWIWVRALNIYGDGVHRRKDLGVFGFTIRCLKDL